MIEAPRQIAAVRRPRLKALLVLLLAAGCDTRDYTDIAERHLGTGTVCATHTGDGRSSVVRCTRDGQMFVCTVHGERVGCAVDNVTLPEGK